MTVINILPIKWFGDIDAYMKSPVKIITVGLNPSDKEFREKNGDPFTTKLRFPDYIVGNDASLEKALNCYFEKNPYRQWFNTGLGWNLIQVWSIDWLNKSTEVVQSILKTLSSLEIK